MSGKEKRFLYRCNAVERPALLGACGKYESFTIDLPSYWRAKIWGMLKDPSTWAAQAIVVAYGGLMPAFAKLFEFIVKKAIGRVVRKILHKVVGPDYEVPDRVIKLIANYAYDLIFKGLDYMQRHIAYDILATVGKHIVRRIVPIAFAGLRGKKEPSIIGKLLRPLKTEIVTKVATAVFKETLRWMLRMPLRLLKIFGTAWGILIDMVLQFAIELGIETTEYLLWPTFGVARKRGVGLIGGPNVLSTLQKAYNFVFSRKYFAVHSQSVRPRIRTGVKTGFGVAKFKARRTRTQFSIRHLYRAPRWVYVLRKPRVRHACRFGELARFLLPGPLSSVLHIDNRTLVGWNFVLSDLVLKIVPDPIACVGYVGKGTRKAITPVPLAGAPIAEGLLRELDAYDEMHTDAVQGYYYLSGLAFAAPILGTAVLIRMTRQDMWHNEYIHHALKNVGAQDYTTITWEPPGR